MNVFNDIVNRAQLRSSNFRFYSLTYDLSFLINRYHCSKRSQNMRIKFAFFCRSEKVIKFFDETEFEIRQKKN